MFARGYFVVLLFLPVCSQTDDKGCGRTPFSRGGDGAWCLTWCFIGERGKALSYGDGRAAVVDGRFWVCV